MKPLHSIASDIAADLTRLRQDMLEYEQSTNQVIDKETKALADQSLKSVCELFNATLKYSPFTTEAIADSDARAASAAARQAKQDAQLNELRSLISHRSTT